MKRSFSLLDRAGAFVRTKGFYLVLAGCLATAGAAALLALSPAPEAENAPAGQSQDERLEEVLEATPSPTPALTPAPALQATPEPETSSAPENEAPLIAETGEEDAAEASSSSLLFCPVEGEVIRGFAGDALVYSKTLDQWTSHDGVDIAAPEGSPVLAVADGVVTRCENDTMMGYTLALSHDGGRESVYANLDELPDFAVGESLKAGTELGAVGNTAIAESAEEAHLHFELWEDGVPIDPVPEVRGLSSVPIK